jgi:IS5 family transposase
MRKTRIQQLPLAEATPDHPKAKELKKISEILDHNSSIYDLVLQDLGMAANETGSQGMTAEQVIRAAITKQLEGFSYRELAFHLADSRIYGWFCRIGIGRSFEKSTLQRCIKSISDTTWEQINRTLLGFAKEEKIETGRKVRVVLILINAAQKAAFFLKICYRVPVRIQII